MKAENDDLQAEVQRLDGVRTDLEAQLAAAHEATAAEVEARGALAAEVEALGKREVELQAAAKAKLANVEEREAELKGEIAERDAEIETRKLEGEIDADGPSATGSTEPAPMT